MKQEDKHWINGGRLLTNFNVALRPAYEAAIEDHPEYNFSIKDKAYASNGKELDWCNALLVPEDGIFPDTGPFFETVKRVRRSLGIHTYCN